MDQQPFPLPTFFVIGAPKAGTTSLHAYLARHPDISMSSVKEPFVFATDRFAERLPEYGELLDAAAPVRGESSTVYSQHPHFGPVPTRIHSAVPTASFLYLVRDPLERAIAHYRQRVADGKDRRTLDIALADFASPDSTYLSASRYATQIRLYLERFPRERIMVLDQTELRENRSKLLTRVFEFLGVSTSTATDLPEANLNARDDLREPTAVGRHLRGSRLLELGRRAPLPAPLRRRARGIVARPVAVTPLDPGLRDEIVDSLRDEVAWLRRFSGQSFAGWSL